MITVPRDVVVATARTYLNTPFHHQARLKGVGIDCVGLIICTAKELGLVPPTFDVKGYPAVPDGHSFMHLVQKYMVEIDRVDAQQGDVMVMRYDADPQHMAFLSPHRHGNLGIIHAASNEGRVIETRLMFSEYMKFVGTFRIPGVV